MYKVFYDNEDTNLRRWNYFDMIYDNKDSCRFITYQSDFNPAMKRIWESDYTDMGMNFLVAKIDEEDEYGNVPAMECIWHQINIDRSMQHSKGINITSSIPMDNIRYDGLFNKFSREFIKTIIE